ncbi:MAG TPA: hypothetical protein VFY93_01130 [Planctomycetota bacterium]|nr:hypothetical protein [Planctomycetota bacterium]
MRARAAQPRSSFGPAIPYLAGAAVLLAVAIFFVATRKPAVAPPAPPPTPAPAAAPDPDEARRAEAHRWFVDTFFDEMRRDRELPGARVDELFEAGRKLGYDKIPGFEWEEERRKIYVRLLAREPNHPEANRAVGLVPLVDYPDFFDTFRKLTDAKVLPPELTKVRDKYEDKVRFVPQPGAPAVPPDEFKRVSALLDEFKELNHRYETDPSYKAIAEALARVKIDPILGQYDFVHVEMRPFVLFYGSRELKTGDADVARRLKARLELYRKLIEDLVEFHRERWIKPLGLKEFEPGEVFCVWVFGDHDSWEDYGRQSFTVITPGTKGYFSHRDHWAFVYDDPKERLGVDVAVAHELTHLLQWHYSKDPGGEFPNHFDRLSAVWFSEGWAEYVGWVKREGDKYVFGQDSPLRMECYQLFKKLELPLYPLQEFVKREDYADWNREVFFTWLPRKIRMPDKQEQQAVLLSAYFGMLYSQSWLFMKFLYDGEGGKYREKTLKFTKAALRGFLDYKGERGYARAYEVFGEIFELKTKGDWDRFQAEFDRFLEGKLYSVQPLK